jgi:UDP-glucose 4-epimerase
MMILVTGGVSYIGSYTVSNCLKLGKKFLCLIAATVSH